MRKGLAILPSCCEKSFGNDSAEIDGTTAIFGILIIFLWKKEKEHNERKKIVTQ